jgi:hypothetical protein
VCGGVGVWGGGLKPPTNLRKKDMNVTVEFNPNFGCILSLDLTCVTMNCIIVVRV